MIKKLVLFSFIFIASVANAAPTCYDPAKQRGDNDCERFRAAISAAASAHKPVCVSAGLYSVQACSPVLTFTTPVQMSPGVRMNVGDSGTAYTFKSTLDAPRSKLFIGSRSIQFDSLQNCWPDTSTCAAAVGEVYPEWWGAGMRDGITSDSAAIQSAINSLGTKAGVVQLNGGTYEMASTLTITNSGIVLAGKGKRVTFLVPKSDGSVPLVSFISIGNTGGAQINGIEVRDLTLEGRLGSGTEMACFGIFIDNTLSTYIHNINVSRFVRTADVGETVCSAFQTFSGFLEANNTSGYGIVVRNSYNIQIANSRFFANNVSVGLDSVQSATIGPRNEFTFSGSYSGDKNGAHAVLLMLTNITSIVDNLFEAEQTTLNEVYCYSPINLNIRGNRFEGAAVPYNITIEYLVTEAYRDSIGEIANNYFTGNNTRTKAIKITRAAEGKIAANTFFSFKKVDGSCDTVDLIDSDSVTEDSNNYSNCVE